MWAVGIVVPLYMGLLIAGGVQLYLLNGRVSGIGSSVDNINSTVNAMRLKQVSSKPTDPQNIAEAKTVLAAARSSQIKIDRDVITATGTRFVEASQSNPSTWDVALAFLDYKSFLTSLIHSSPIPSGAKVIHFEATRYEIPTSNIIETPKGDSSAHRMRQIFQKSIA